MRLRWYANALSELLPIALTHGIEPDIARNLAREFDVRPEPLDIEEWPWPVKIYTLGRFGVVLRDKPLSFPRKTPRRLIGLLKALVSFAAACKQGGESPECRQVFHRSDGAQQRSFLRSPRPVNARAAFQSGDELHS